MATKEEIRPIYAELQGYYSQAIHVVSYAIEEKSVWEQYNAAVDALSEASNEDYSRFKVTPEPEKSVVTASSLFHGVIEGAVETENIIPERIIRLGYCNKLAGLLSKLHAIYFADEPSPLANSPSMVINQTQQQSQTVHLILELTEQLTRSETQFKEGSKEHGFIDKAKDYLKSAVGGTTSMTKLMLMILKVAKECGLSIEDMQRVFGG